MSISLIFRPFTEVPTSPDNRGLTVPECCYKEQKILPYHALSKALNAIIYSPPSLTDMVKCSLGNIPMFEDFCNVNYVCLNIFNLSVIKI